MTVSIRSAGAVDVRSIAEDGERMFSPIDMRKLASARGIDRTFALRELITSQKRDYDRLNNIQETLNNRWKNWLNDHKASATRYRPRDPDDVRLLVLSALQSDKRIRAVGAGHSHSNAAKPDDQYVQLSWYNSDKERLEPVELTGVLSDRPRIDSLSDASNFGPGDDPATDIDELHAVRVGAGAVLKRLNRKVLAEKNLALLNMGSFDAQTMAGATNTSTHGTGKDLGTIADSVLAVEMLTVMESPVAADDPLVRHLRIEPTDGITDPDKFMANVGDHGMALIQNDEVFHSAVVGYGAMGIATAYTIKVRDRYFLKETTEVHRWNDLKGENGLLQEKLSDSTVRHVNFLVNIPETIGSNPTDNPKCMLRWREHRPWADGPDEGWPPERRFSQTGTFFRMLRNVTTGSGVDPKTPNPGLGALVSRFFSNQSKQSFQTPDGDTYTQSASYIVLRRKRDHTAGNPDKPPDPPQPATSTEVAIDLTDVETAVEAVISKVQAMKTNQDLHYMAPLGVRFTKASKHTLSPEYGFHDEKASPRTNIAMIELPFAVGPVKEFEPGWFWYVTHPISGLGISLAKARNLIPNRDISQSRMRQYSKTALLPIEKLLRRKFDGHPHMGKLHSMDRSAVEGTYEDFDTWLDVYRTFNARGTFDNEFTKGLEL